MRSKRSGVLRSVHAAAARGIVVQIQGDGESAKRALQMVQEELRRTEAAAAAAKRQADFNGVFNVAKQTLAIAGLTASLAGLAAMTEHVVMGALNLGETLEKASKRTGLQVETLSTLHYIAGVTNQDFDGMTAAVAKMDKTIGGAVTGNKAAAAVMKELGLDAKDLAGRSDGAEIAFKTLTARIAATENPIVRVKLATDALGKAGAQQIPMLIDVGQHWDEWVAKAKAAGVYLDGPGAAALAKTSREMKELGADVEGAGVAFTRGLIPGLQNMFNIIRSNKGDMSDMESFGNLVARGLNYAGAAAYGTAAAMAKVLELRQRMGGEASKADADAWKQVYEDDKKQMNDALFFAQYGVAHGAAESRRDHNRLNGPTATGDSGLVGAGKPGKSDNPIAKAAAALAEENARAELAGTKTLNQAQLAQLDTQHRLLLLSDQAYFDEKLRLENSTFDAEQKALNDRRKTLTDLASKQAADPLLKKDKNGNKAEQLNTLRELKQLDEAQAELDAKRNEAESRHTGEIGASNQAAELAGLRAAAALERERNTGITAQIALIQREHELEAQKSTLAGGTDATAQQIRDAGTLAVQKLQLQQIDQETNRIQADYRRNMEDVNDAVTKGQMTKREAAEQTRKNNATLLAQLKDEAAAYRTIAEAAGDPDMLEKAKDLEQTIRNLGRPDNRGTYGKELQEGLQGITSSIVDSAARGKQSFADMARSILDDLDRLALKMAEEKFLLPLFEGAFGAGKGQTPGAQGGGFGGGFGFPSIAGAQLSIPDFGGGGGGPSVYKPEAKQGGGFLGGAIGLVSKLASSALGSRTPNVTSNIINNSSQPVQAGQPDIQFDSDMKEWVINTVLENHLQGGALSQV